MEWLEHIDQQLFLLIHHIRFYVLDIIIPHATSFPTWTPLFLIAIYFLYKKFKQKIIIVLLSFALLIGISDPLSNAIKKSVKRYRPSHNIELSKKIISLNNYKGGKYGFVSSHAANSFGIAILMILFFNELKKRWKLLILCWAIFICYTRIYLGVHYPADLIGGALIGCVSAYLSKFIFNQLDRKYYKQDAQLNQL
jgi:undecaprenyl-diphosphatase